MSGQDYYGARYYDPVAGIFLSPDNVQGNAEGMDPYAYVAGNPETLTDPTGETASTCDLKKGTEPCLSRVEREAAEAVANASKVTTQAGAATALAALENATKDTLSLGAIIGLSATLLGILAGLAWATTVLLWKILSLPGGSPGSSSSSSSTSTGGFPDESRSALAQGQTSADPSGQMGPIQQQQGPPVPIVDIPGDQGAAIDRPLPEVVVVLVLQRRWIHQKESNISIRFKLAIKLWPTTRKPTKWKPSQSCMFGKIPIAI